MFTLIIPLLIIHTERINPTLHCCLVSIFSISICLNEHAFMPFNIARHSSEKHLYWETNYHTFCFPTFFFLFVMLTFSDVILVSKFNIRILSAYICIVCFFEYFLPRHFHFFLLFIILLIFLEFNFLILFK